MRMVLWFLLGTVLKEYSYSILDTLNPLPSSLHPRIHTYGHKLSELRSRRQWTETVAKREVTRVRVELCYWCAEEARKKKAPKGADFSC